MAKAELITEIDELGFRFVIAEKVKGSYRPIKRNNKELVFRDCDTAQARFDELLMERKREDQAIPYTESEAREFIKKYSHLRKFAKTYADSAPHSYYIKEWFDEEGQKEYERFIALFKQKKVDGMFYTHKFSFFILDNEYFFPWGHDNLAMEIINVNTIDNLELRNGIYYYKRNN